MTEDNGKFELMVTELNAAIIIIRAIGLSHANILRILQFTKRNTTSIQLRYREKFLSHFLVNLFNIPLDQNKST